MKSKTIQVNNKTYLRIPVKTDILKKGDNIINLIKKYAVNQMQKDDIITISESPLAITQGRAINTKNIKVGFLAKLLWRFVYNNPCGTGLRCPYSMQCAINECGAFRILFAAIVAGFGKIFKIKGLFYRIAGMQAALIDGAGTSPVPPYNETVILGPKNPSKVARQIKKELGFDACIMDINDIGGSWVIGASKGVNKKLLEAIMKDNPQGQGDELTPFCIVRKQ